MVLFVTSDREILQTLFGNDIKYCKDGTFEKGGK
jgi:hypothetical protein